MAGGFSAGLQAGGAAGGPWGAAAGGVLGLLSDSYGSGGGGGAPSGPVVSSLNQTGLQNGFFDGSGWAVNFGGTQTASASAGNQGGYRPPPNIDGQPVQPGQNNAAGMSMNSIVTLGLIGVILMKLMA